VHLPKTLSRALICQERSKEISFNDGIEWDDTRRNRRKSLGSAKEKR